MPKDDELRTFQYEAIAPNGSTRVKGKRARMTAFSAETVRKELTSQGFIPIEITEVKTGGANTDIGALLSPKRGAGPKMKSSALASFTRALHELLKAGISVPRALQTLAEDAPKPEVAELCMELSGRMSAGVSLTEAFSAFPRTFDDVFLAYISAGEKTGSLPDATGRLAALFEKRSHMKTKIMSVAIYPLMISLVIGVLVVGILLFLVPQYEKVYASFGAKLPGPTQTLIDFSKYVPYIVVIGAIGTFLLSVWLKRESKANSPVGVGWNKIRFRMPVIGKLSKNVALYRWATTVAGAMDAGLRPVSAMELAAAASGSAWLRAITPKMNAALESGRQLSTLLVEEPNLFSPAIRTMVSTGEQAGELPKMLDSASSTINSAIDGKVATMGAQLEVLLLVAMAVVVGGLLVVLYLPILNLSSEMGKSMSG
jgi:type IV pilus assembly protein PilC